MKASGQFLLCSLAFCGAAGIIGHNLTADAPPRVTPNVGSSLVVFHYGQVGNVNPPTRLDVAMDTFPGSLADAVAWCDDSAGELIGYGPGVTGMVCEGVDY